ncbi:MAG: FadR family transcriptional regulator [Planctomycetes bacterium]|nr:FadR family transcriptional regulator [Planctomycetota bacterium]
MSVLDKIKEVRVPRPTDHIIKQLKELIVSGELRPGDLLPGERELAARFGLGRGYIREAIKTFELYGVFRSIPGKGTIVNDLSFEIYGDFLNNIVQFGTNDHLELLDVREILEPNVAFRAAMHATDEEIERIGDELRTYRRYVDEAKVVIEVECRFHINIANAAHNRFLSVIMGTIIPELTRVGKEIEVLRDHRLTESYDEHMAVWQAIANRDPEEACRAMQHHIDKTKETFVYCLGKMQDQRPPA